MTEDTPGPDGAPDAPDTTDATDATAGTMTDVTGPHGGERFVTAGAPAMAAEAAVVLLHGRGATPEGFVRGVASDFYRHGVTFLAPAAYHGSWYPRAFDAPVEANEPHLSSAVDCVRHALDRASDAGVPPERTVLVGFSQGACVAAEYAIRNRHRYGGLGVLSGAVPGTGAAGDGARGGDGGIDARIGTGPADSGSLAGTPALVGCDETDPHVSRDAVRETTAILGEHGADVTERIYADAGHAVTEDEMDWIRDRLDALVDAAD
ncbi:alpha/beta hydrolase [Haloparvum sp. PAK95]|uniref:alpha/beta hydrolase n=1 Tax=Haloparvum sp. PAK95 TaxID=3418962 RepID=UPI003D2EE058